MRSAPALAVALLLSACGRAAPPGPASDPMVHTLVLPDVPPAELPDAPGRAMFYGACSTCHTPRYVRDQPPLSRKQWAAEVAKMRHVYGAPFPDDMTRPVVDYLVAARGTGS